MILFTYPSTKFPNQTSNQHTNHPAVDISCRLTWPRKNTLFCLFCSLVLLLFQCLIWIQYRVILCCSFTVRHSQQDTLVTHTLSTDWPNTQARIKKTMEFLLWETTRLSCRDIWALRLPNHLSLGWRLIHKTFSRIDGQYRTLTTFPGLHS